MSKQPVLLRLAIVLALSSSLAACGPSGRGAGTLTSTAPGAITLRDDLGRDEQLSSRTARSNLTVLLFFSSDCPVQKAHDGRIRELAQTYGSRGVSFYAVVSEVGADMRAEREAAKQRGFVFPVLEDRGAALADALGVDFSTHSVVLDRDASVLYSGGIDSDRTHLSSGAERWLERALQASLEGKPIEKASTEPLGCPLRKH
jgi:peroxiredoxin